MWRRSLIVVAAGWMVLGAARVDAADRPAGAEALLVILGDQHSAYERTAQVVARVDELRSANRDLPLAILLNGDTQEYGNVVAERSRGAIDFAMYAALARRGPTIVNLGNHEPEFYALDETVRRIAATGALPVGSPVNAATGRPFADGGVRLRLGSNEALLVGYATDQLSTFRAAVRGSLTLPQPADWLRENLPRFTAMVGGLNAQRPLIILSHAGIAADREAFPLVPDGSLFAGAHDHVRFIHRLERTVYVHSGSWNELITLAWLCRDASGAIHWEVDQQPISLADPADPELAALIAATAAAHLTDEDRAAVGYSAEALDTATAGRFAARALRVAGGGDAAFVGNTTFGSGLPAGPISRAAFTSFVRFDGDLRVAEISGSRLLALLAKANPSPDTPFDQRQGEFLFADGPETVDPAKTYRIITNDWAAQNSARYFGEPVIVWSPLPEPVKVRAAILAQLPIPADLPATTATQEIASGQEPVTTPPADALKPMPSHPPSATSAPVADNVEDAAESLMALGRELFETYAPEEFKAQFEFPTRERWDEFAQRLQRSLQESDSLAELAAYAAEARAAATALQAIPGYEDFGGWLEQRIDEIEGADVARQAPPEPIPTEPPSRPAPPTRPGQTAPAAPKSPPRATRPGSGIPHYALWTQRVQGRALPPRARELAPRLQRAFAAEGVPTPLIWIAEAESSFNPSARSPVGARGLFQFMPETARSLGLSTMLPDDRTDPDQSARAAARYLKQLHGRFGEWPLALAAYNAGEGRVGRLLATRNGRTYADIADRLPAETRMYVPKVLALVALRTNTPPEQLAAP